jgi:hypothetical protein
MKMEISWIYVKVMSVSDFKDKYISVHKIPAFAGIKNDKRHFHNASIAL